MVTILSPWQWMSIALAGWLNRQQQTVIEYLLEENRVLREQVGTRRIRFTDAQRRRLAVRAHALGRTVLREMDTLVTPDTLLAWHRKLVAHKWTFARSQPGRPAIAQEIVDLILRMARENPRWGYRRVQGALDNLGHSLSASTVRNVLKRHGIEPAPERGRRTTWATFLRAYWGLLVATDFFTLEVWTPRGLVTHLLAVHDSPGHPARSFRRHHDASEHRAIHPISKGGMSGPHHSIRRGVPTSSSQ